MAKMAIEASVRNYLNLLKGQIAVSHQLSMAVSRFLLKREHFIPTPAQGKDFGLELNCACKETWRYLPKKQIPPHLYDVFAVRLGTVCSLVVHSTVVVDDDPLSVLNIDPVSREIEVVPFQWEYGNWLAGRAYLIPTATAKVLALKLEYGI